MDAQHLAELTRREFLRRTTTGGAAAAGLGGLALGCRAEDKKATTKPAGPEPKLPYTILGATDQPITRITFGTVVMSSRRDTRLVKMAIDYGINMIHTSPTYTGGNAIRVLGTVFGEDKNYREKVMLGLKSHNPQREEELDEALKQLNTDHLEFLFPTLHGPDPGRMEVLQESMEKYKKKGKIRYTGFVCHRDMIETTQMVLDKAPEFFNAVLLAMPYVPTAGDKQRGEKEREKRVQLLKNVHQMKDKGIGIFGMKGGARQAVSQGEEVFKPLAKSLLAAGAHTVLTSITSRRQLEMIKELDLESLKQKPEEKQAARAFHEQRAQACLMCGDCNRACPEALPVSDLMRIQAYCSEMGWWEHARGEFRELGISGEKLAASCASCGSCTSACPLGLKGSEAVRFAAGQLS
jgi:predicted aldo/keto reductase-like oxidoreductase